MDVVHKVAKRNYVKTSGKYRRWLQKREYESHYLLGKKMNKLSDPAE